MVRALVDRPALGNFPSLDMEEVLSTGLLRATLPGLDQVFTASTGSDANETAYKAASMWRRARERGDADFTVEEIESAMQNRAPGAPEYSIMSFNGGLHGRTFGSLATTRSKPIHKLDILSFDWPSAPFPKLQYPLDQFVSGNAAEEQRCIDEIEHVLDTATKPVVVIVVEPIQSEGGDNHASAAFFRELRALTEQKGVLLVVDEVQTGVGASGKFWAHEHWDLPTPPDIVTFSKKAQAAGFYYGKQNLRPNEPYRQFNTWMGDLARAIIFRAIFEEIERLNLVDNAAQVGSQLYSSLEQLSKKYPHEIQNLRGKDRGTFIAWDSPRREDVIAKALCKGVLIGSSGANAIRLRPMLIFQNQHGKIEQFLVACGRTLTVPL
jgi:4-aminobutyrate aminotransferase/(S)-3-amino-2-methylpropionate transaminase